MLSPKLLPALLLPLFSVGVFADVVPNPLFSDGVILRRDTVVPVWGTATREGEKVSVTLDGASPVTTVARNGKWRVDLPATAGGKKARTLTIAGDNVVVVKDVLFGEVWICAGQSNMEMNFLDQGNKINVEGREMLPEIANMPTLRVFDVPNLPSLSPVAGSPAGKWVASTPETAKKFSAVGFFFARDLKKNLGDVPVGLIECDWGNTMAESWMSRAGLEKVPGMPARLATFDKLYAEGKTYCPANCGCNKYAAGNLNYHTPSALFTGMVEPLIPFAFSGVIWYQGESNGYNPKVAKEYETLFPALISDWRAQWGRGDFPFLFVQIAPYGNQHPELREAQRLTLEKLPATAMVVTLDIGDLRTIHPPKKAPVGERLALAARATVYGEKIEYSGPLFAGATFFGNKATVRFTHVGDGLELRPAPDAPKVRVFELAGADGKFFPAEATIAGDTLELTAAGVGAPFAVRYGWSNTPAAVLFNKNGLPASPFAGKKAE